MVVEEELHDRFLPAEKTDGQGLLQEEFEVQGQENQSQEHSAQDEEKHIKKHGKLSCQ